MIIRPIALIPLLVMTLNGCFFGDKFYRTNTATIVVEGLPHRRSADAIFVDPSLRPQVNESLSGGLLSGYDTKQKVVINSDRPLKLVPDTREPPVDKVATTHAATITVTGPKNNDPIYPILIDPGLLAEVNETSRVNDFWGMDIRQQVKVHSSVPLRLMPATTEDLERCPIKPIP
jgi:hypothetical protein